MKKILTGLVLIILFSGCLKNKTMCSYNPCEVSAPASEVSAIESFLTANSVTATKHCSGFYYILDAAGSGKSPDICSMVGVKYKGSLSGGSVFDQTTTERNFNLNQLIDAWKKGILLLKPGGKIRMWVPPSLGYGSQVVKDGSGNIIIPANSMLIFEVELVSVL